MSIEYIRQLSQEQGRRARRQGKKPRVFTDRGSIGQEVKAIPNLGSYCPAGWEHLEGRDLFVDKSGMGEEGEPALTFRGMVEQLERLFDEDPGYGYALVEEGQFQVYVGVFRQKTRARRKKISAGATGTPLSPLMEMLKKAGG